jgi:hypothetical protein
VRESLLLQLLIQSKWFLQAHSDAMEPERKLSEKNDYPLTLFYYIW